MSIAWASNLADLIEKNIEPVRLGPLAVERQTLIDQGNDYRILIREQKDVLRSTLEFTRLLIEHARQTLARADRILDPDNRR